MNKDILLLDPRTGERSTVDALMETHSLAQLCEMVAMGDLELISALCSPRPSDSDHVKDTD